jgi:hypothetical protein
MKWVDMRAMRFLLLALAAWLLLSILIGIATARFIEVGWRKPWPERSPESLKGSVAGRRTAA